MKTTTITFKQLCRLLDDYRLESEDGWHYDSISFMSRDEFMREHADEAPARALLADCGEGGCLVMYPDNDSPGDVLMYKNNKSIFVGEDASLRLGVVDPCYIEPKVVYRSYYLLGRLRDVRSAVERLALSDV